MNKEEAKKQIDADDASINGVKLITTCRAKEIIDAIDDHQKVKLPREVGKEFDTWIANNQDGYGGRISDLCGSLWDEIQELSATTTFANESEEKYFKVIDAYRYGWEAEPEELFYVLGPESWENRNAVHDRQCNGELDTGIHFSDEGPSPLETPDEEYAFTRTELKQYHLDSEIFTLVPVEVTDDEQ